MAGAAPGAGFGCIFGRWRELTWLGLPQGPAWAIFVEWGGSYLGWGFPRGRIGLYLWGGEGVNLAGAVPETGLGCVFGTRRRRRL